MLRFKQSLSSENHIDFKMCQASLEKLRIKIIDNIKNNYGIDMTIKMNKKKVESATSNLKPLMEIGTKDIYNNMSHRQVRNQDFVRTVLALNHENTHVFQNRELFQQKNPNKFDRLMAMQKVISTAIPEYYNKTYWDSNLFELQAEYQGISDTVEYFKENFPEIDVEKELVNIINSEDYWYAKRPVQSLEDAYNKLDRQAEKSLSANVQLYKNSFGLDQNSPAFQTFYQQIDMDAFNEKSADEQRNILLQFVAEYTPSVIRHCKALSDIPTADGPDRIPLDGELYRKHTDLSAKSTHAARVNYLENRFDNVLAAAETLERDDSQYE